MAPKKLTDCPENLREAIDWLIQVKNGGDRKGLENLAKALKKLIEDAIENAESSLKYRESKLCCTGNASRDAATYPTITPLCKAKDAEIEEAQKNLKTKNSTPYANTDDFKKEIDALEATIKKAEASKNDCAKTHYISKEERLKGLEEVRQQREIVKKLSDFKESLTGNNDILTHLCSGLETFLGFNSKSKGYTGQGIVYSDLDRLCDGVMGFLSGVLGAVKDDPSVTTYYTKMDETLKTIKQNMHNPGGLSKAVEAVSNALREWDGDLQKKIDKVVKDGNEGTLYALKTNIATNIKEVEKLNDLSSKSFEEIVDQWKETVTRGLARSVKNADSAINNLDKPLKNKIIIEFDRIKMQIDKLNESTVRDVKQLSELARHVNFELHELKKSVYFAIDRRVGELQKKLTEDFTIIHDEINTVSDTLKKHVDALNLWIKAAQDLVDNALPQIQNILNEIESDGSKGKGHPKAIRQNADTMNRKANALRQAVEAAKKVLKPLVETIKQKVTELESVYKKTLINLQQNVQSQVSAAQNVLGQLNDEVKNDLSNKVQTHIKEEIEKVIKAFQAGANKAKGFTATGTVQFIQEFRIGVDGTKDAKTLAKWATSARNTGSLYSALDALQVQEGNFKTFTAVLKALEEYKHDDKNFYECIIADLEYKLQEAISVVKRGLGTYMSNYHSHVKTEGAIYKAIEKVKKDVGEYFEDAQAGGGGGENLKQDKLDENGYTKNKGALQTEIGKIQSQGLHLFEKFKSPGADEINDKTFITLKTLITQNLDDFIRVIQENASHEKSGHTGIKQKLEKLRNTYFMKNHHDDNNSIYKIEKDLETLQSERLVSLMNKAQTFLVDTIPKQAKECITAIKKHLKGEVTNTIENIKMDALERYVDSKSQELEVLKKCVDKRCDTIKTIVDGDNEKGIKGLLKIVKKQLSGAALQITDQTILGGFPSKVQILLEAFWDYIGGQLTGDDDDDVLSAFVGVKTKMATLFTDLTHFSHEFRNNLYNFSDALNNLKPGHFGGQSSPLLDVFKKGCESMIGELRKAYVAAYSGAFSIDWIGPKTDEISQDGINCAEIFFTILVFIYKHLLTLNEKCGEKGEWVDKKICLMNSNDEYNSLGDFLEDCGFHVTEKEDTPDNELRCHGNMKGSNMIQRLMQKQIKSPEEIKHLQKCSSEQIEKSKKQFTFFDILHCMFTHLKEYYSLCHIANPSSKQPCSVFEMLNWLAGLHYTAVYPKLLRAGIESLFVDPDKQKTKSIESLHVTVVDQTSLSLAAYPNNITYNKVKSAIEHICSKSYIVLTSIVGTGNSETTYGVNFCTNSLGLKYPISGEDCLHTVIDICRKVIPPLRFLQTQCKMSAQHGGWEQCRYGKDVPSAKWPCTENAIDQPTCQQTSPLMSYLNDCLPGHLPHLLTSVGCKSECKTCPSGKPGMPCITPLGFRGFSGSTSTGRDLCEILNELLDDVDLSALLCVIPKPPSTLPDHFGFALTLVHGWYDGAKNIKNSFQRHLYDAITKQSISLYHDPGVLSDALRKAYCSQPPNGGNEHKNAEHSDVFSLSLNNYTRQCSGDKHCARYIYSLSSDSHYYIANKHASVCLSWALYLPWQFHTYLNSLLQELKEIFCRDWECSKCLHGKKCKPGHHGVIHTKTQNSSCQCDSVVRCRGVLPTLYKYGFTFGDPSALNDVRDPKTCSNLCSQLEKVIKSSYFTVLFNECDKFLWTIRLPFSYLLLSLWLLSLLYLLHILVIRLDLLHIKSHLHSPSSHRIAAQSLLAAARVGKLAKTSYLQP